MKCVEVKNLSYSYSPESEPVLKNVSLEINKGEYVSIVGHNGCGKSTLCKLLIGLYEKNSGDIIIDGLSLNRENLSSIRKKVAIVFQNPDNQFIGATVEDDIAFSLENDNVPRDQMVSLVKEYATKVGMENFLSKEPSYLSGGQKQRVALADALVRNPEILILDEATSMLDPEGTNDIINLIHELNKEYHKTIISITHDLDFARLSDNVIVMRDGRVAKEGTPEEIFNDGELLKSSNLDMPLSLKTYHLAKESELNKNTKLMEALWEYHLTK